MIFSIQDLTFTLGKTVLEGYAALLARVICSLIVLAVGFAVRRGLHSYLFPKLLAFEWKHKPVPILLHSFALPTERIAWFTGIYLALVCLPWGAVPAEAFFLKIYRMAVILCLCHGLYGASDLMSLMLSPFSPEVRDNKTLLSALIKVYHALIIIIGVIMIAQESGLPVSGILTGAGLTGLTISLAAQDSASNLFSGLVILLERPFQIGDWISVGDVEGSVEDISFRSTKIRALDNSIYILTNSSVCSNTINNCAQRQKRLYRFTLGVTYSTTRTQLEQLMADLTSMLKEQPEVYEESAMVRLTGFGSSSIDLLVSAYLKTTDAAIFLQMQNDLNLRIMDVMQKDGVEFAFPSTSVYIEKGAPAQQLQN